MNAKLIACRSIIDEMSSFLPSGMATEVFEIGLHTHPQVLHHALQRAIERADGSCEPLLLGYGLCGGAAVGLVAKRSRIIIPKRHDCVGVFLGSDEARRRELDFEPGTLYLTHGYIESYARQGLVIGEDIQKRRGAGCAGVLTNRMIERYRRVMYLRNTQPQDLEGDRTYAREMATQFNMSYAETEADSSLLRRLIQFEWKHDFVVVQPGREIRLEDFL